MKDLASFIHRVIYGRSDKANAGCNQSAEWQAGYAAVIDNDKTGEWLIEMEWRRRDYCMPDEPNFREWKRGMWAATFQRLL
jgi:hypothetical protein